MLRPSCIIYDSRQGGLANRIRALLAYEALATALTVPFYLCWRRNWECDEEFAALFQSPIKLIDETELAARLEGGGAQRTTSLWFPAVWRAELQDSMSLEVFARRVQSGWQQLCPLPAIAEAVEAAFFALDLATCHGVHVRYSDNLRPYSEWSLNAGGQFSAEHRSHPEFFLEHLARSQWAGPLFLATDNPSVEDEFRSRFGARVRTWTKKYQVSSHGALARTSSVRDGLIELLLLAKCPTVLGSYYSSFSKLAALWGGADYHELRGNTCVRAPEVLQLQKLLWRRANAISSAAGKSALEGRVASWGTAWVSP